MPTEDGDYKEDLDYRYEDVFTRMNDLQWYDDNGVKKRRGYLLAAGNPIQMKFYDATKDSGYRSYSANADKINCCGSTVSSVYLEMERKFMASQTGAPKATFEDVADDDLDKRDRLPPHDGYALWVPLKGVDGIQEGTKKGIEEFGIGFGLTHPENMRRGDAAQIWWLGYPNLSGHNVFIWDIRVSEDGNVDFQMLSGNDPDGVGIHNSSATKPDNEFLPTDHAYCLRVMQFAGSWARYRAGEQSWGNRSAGTPRKIPEIHVARFYRKFPYWPIHLGTPPGNRSGFVVEANGNRPGQGGVLISDPDGESRPMVETLYENTEKGNGGFYPVGRNRTWHGGVHLRPAAAHGPVYAVSDGVIIAARMAETDDDLAEQAALAGQPLLSRNFVLLRHQVKIDDQEKVFYCLYMHLDGTRAGSELMESRWLWKLRSLPADNEIRERLDRGGVVHLAEPVAAGDIVGHVAAAPEGEEVQLHWEIFSDGEKDPLVEFSRIKGGKELAAKIEDDNHDLFVDKVDENTSNALYDILSEAAEKEFFGWDSVLTEWEIQEFFHSNPRREELRYYVTKHVSEWSAEKIDWSLVKDADRWKWADPENFINLQTMITTYAWWWESLARHGGDQALPESHVVWTYHPVTFLAWLADNVAGDPSGNQMEQDAKSFAEGAGAGWTGPTEPAGPRVPGLFRIKTDSGSLVLFEKIEPDSVLFSPSLTAHGHFHASEEKDVGINKFAKFSAWIAVGTGGDMSGVETAPTGGQGDGRDWKLTDTGRACFEDENGSPGEIFAEAQRPLVKGTVTQAGDWQQAKIGSTEYDFVRFEGWICTGTTAEVDAYAAPA